MSTYRYNAYLYISIYIFTSVCRPVYIYIYIQDMFYVPLVPMYTYVYQCFDTSASTCCMPTDRQTDMPGILAQLHTHPEIHTLQGESYPKLASSGL